MSEKLPKPVPQGTTPERVAKALLRRITSPAKPPPRNG